MCQPCHVARVAGTEVNLLPSESWGQLRRQLVYSYHKAPMPQGPGMVRTREDEALSHHLEPVGMARTARVTGRSRCDETEFCIQAEEQVQREGPAGQDAEVS